MACWSDVMVKIMRAIINDWSQPYTYTDARLTELIVVSAQLTQGDISFVNTYTIDVMGNTITPDPIVNGDDSFVNLVSLKAACLVDQGAFRTELGRAGVKIVSDGHQIDTTKRADGYSLLLEQGACQAYKKAKWEYEIGGAQVAGEAILSPFKTWDGAPFDAGGTNRTDRR